MVNLVITLALIFTCVALISKGFPNVFVFLAMGILVAIGLTILAGLSVAVQSSGNIWLDVLEAVKEGFISSFITTGMSLLPIFAYSKYMDKIQASQVLGGLISKPISKAKNPYFVGVFIAIFICGMMRIAIVSAVAIMALFMTTLYPALLRSGISRESAISAIFVGTCFDWGPADFIIAQHLSGVIAGGEVPGLSVESYFFNASIKVIPFVLLITSLLGGFVMQFVDKKTGYVFGTDVPTEAIGPANHENPAFYAILPVVPLIIMLVFSPIFMENINLSVMTAVLLAMIIVFIIETIRKKKIKERMMDMQSWISGLGEAFGSLLTMVIMSQFFASMVGRLNGFGFLVDKALNIGVSGMLLMLIFGALLFVLGIIGGGGVVGITLAATLPKISAVMGVSYYSLQLPMQVVHGFRMTNIGPSMPMQYTIKVSNTKVVDLLKRTIPMAVIMYAATFVLSTVIL